LCCEEVGRDGFVWCVVNWTDFEDVEVHVSCDLFAHEA
jgi:hypothetical protein